MKQIKILLEISLLLFVLLSCDAPHLNPLDPLNPDSKYGLADGFLLTPARVPIVGAKVTWRNQNVVVVTDTNGYYKVENILRNDGWMFYEKEGYTEDSLYVRWNNQKNRRLEEKFLGYTIGTLDGFVFTPPHSAASGVSVTWKNQNIVISTNSSGYYKFENIQTNNGYVYFEKSGLAKDSLFVEWNNAQSVRLDEKILSYTIGTLDGYVFTPVDKPAVNVNVIWKDENKLSVTNLNGYFKIENVPIKNGMLYYERDGLKKDSQFVQWGTLNSLRVDNITLNYNIGQITGSVKTVSLPRQGISNVNVSWKNQNLLVHTDANGNYTLNNVSYKNGWLVFSKENYRSDSTFVQFGNQDTTSIDDVFLNSIPELGSINISTSVIFRYTETRYRLAAQASLIDAEGDVNLVRIKCNALGFDQQLVYNPSTGFYEINYDFGQQNLSSGLGKDFIVIARDNEGYTYTIGSTRISRVIDKEIIPKEPINSAVVSSQPTLVWNRFSPGFSFHYKVEIYTGAIPPELYWSKDNISGDDVRLTPDVTLPSGEYYWVIWCVDEYNNQARSKEASFVVQ